MKTSTFSQTRQHFADTIDAVVSDHNPVLITRQNKEAVVMISLEDYKSMEETAYLMQSLNNVERINNAIEQLEAGLGLNKKIVG